MIRSILIGGCGSSGTTLLAHLLNASDSVFCGPELNLFNKLELYRRSFQYTPEEFRVLLDEGIPTTGSLKTDLLATSTHLRPDSTRNFLSDIDAYGYTKQQVCELAGDCHDFSEFSDRFFAPCLEKAHKTKWAEKTPTNAYCLREFLSSFPFGCYLHIVRDGRDVVPSLMKRGYRAEAAVRRWLHDTAVGYSCRKNERCLMLQYEDLVDRPERVIKRIFQFLNAAEEADQVIEKAKLSKGMFRSLDGWSLHPNQEISNEATLKWKRCQYGDKPLLEQLFRHTYLEEQIAVKWGLPVPCNGNVLLSLCGYDPADDWNVRPKCGPRFLWHYFQESVLGHIRPRRLYCSVSLF